MISYRFVPTSSQMGVLFLRHPVEQGEREGLAETILQSCTQATCKVTGRYTDNDESLLSLR